jgi:hypothetical protein
MSRAELKFARQTCRMVPFIFSLLVQASDRRNSTGNPRRVTGDGEDFVHRLQDAAGNAGIVMF